MRVVVYEVCLEVSRETACGSSPVLLDAAHLRLQVQFALPTSRLAGTLRLEQARMQRVIGRHWLVTSVPVRDCSELPGSVLATCLTIKRNLKKKIHQKTEFVSKSTHPPRKASTVAI